MDLLQLLELTVVFTRESAESKYHVPQSGLVVLLNDILNQFLLLSVSKQTFF